MHRQISHNAPFCNRNVHTSAHICHKMVHCGTWQWCIGGCGTGELWNWSIRLSLSVLCKLTMLEASDCFFTEATVPPLPFYCVIYYYKCGVSRFTKTEAFYSIKMLDIVPLTIIAGDLALRCATAYAHARSTYQVYICIRSSGTRDSGYMHINVRKADRTTHTTWMMHRLW